MRDEKARDQSPSNAAFLVRYYASAIRAWRFDVDGRMHGCRRKARWIADHYLRACKIAGVPTDDEVGRKAQQMIDFGKFRDMEPMPRLQAIALACVGAACVFAEPIVEWIM